MSSSRIWLQIFFSPDERDESCLTVLTYTTTPPTFHDIQNFIREECGIVDGHLRKNISFDETDARKLSLHPLRLEYLENWPGRMTIDPIFPNSFRPTLNPTVADYSPEPLPTRIRMRIPQSSPNHAFLFDRYGPSSKTTINRLCPQENAPSAYDAPKPESDALLFLDIQCHRHGSLTVQTFTNTPPTFKDILRFIKDCTGWEGALTMNFGSLHPISMSWNRTVRKDVTPTLPQDTVVEEAADYKFVFVRAQKGPPRTAASSSSTADYVYPGMGHQLDSVDSLNDRFFRGSYFRLHPTEGYARFEGQRPLLTTPPTAMPVSTRIFPVGNYFRLPVADDELSSLHSSDLDVDLLDTIDVD